MRYPETRRKKSNQKNLFKRAWGQKERKKNYRKEEKKWGKVRRKEEGNKTC